MRGDTATDHDTEHATIEDVEAALERTLEMCERWQRRDLAATLRAARARLARPTTLVCVVGPYKAGKSQLVNALVGQQICPVDDDIATSVITVVYGAERPTARVRRVVDGAVQLEAIAIDRLPDYVTEQMVGGSADVDMVEVGVPGPTLAEGLTLVDTPGIGGLLDRHEATTLRFLRLADAVLFVTDASQELTSPDLAFLRRAREVCPNTIPVLTKVDLYPEWRRILAYDRQHLADNELAVEPVAVSSALRLHGRAVADDTLQRESGIPGLLDLLRSTVLHGARQRNASQAADEVRWALRRLLDPVEHELSLLEDPATAKDGLTRLQELHGRLEQLQRAGSRWSTVLTDGFSDLRAEASHLLRSAARRLLADIDRELEDLDPATDWDAFVEGLQQQLSAVLVEVFTAVDEGARAVRDRIAALLADSDELLPELAVGDHPDVPALSDPARLEDNDATMSGPGALATGLTGLRGGASGMILLGMMGNLAGLAVAGPAALGVATLFGVRQVVDSRRQALRQRRQQARTLVRQYIDDVQLQAENRLRLVVQEHHRHLRDHYTARLRDLSGTTAASLQAAKESLALEEAGRQERVAALRGWADQLRDALTQVPEVDTGAQP